MNLQNTNFATGNARVGVQAGYVGVLRMSSDTEAATDLKTEIAAFRSRLEEARSTGEVDEETYSAARTALDVVTDCIEGETPQRRGPLVVALKRLRGLIGDVADLAAKVSAIIALVKGLP